MAIIRLEFEVIIPDLLTPTFVADVYDGDLNKAAIAFYNQTKNGYGFGEPKFVEAKRMAGQA